jgi:hypothetical protein
MDLLPGQIRARILGGPVAGYAVGINPFPCTRLMRYRILPPAGPSRIAFGATARLIALLLLLMAVPASAQSWSAWEAIPDGQGNGVDFSSHVGSDGYGNNYDHTIHFRFRNRYRETVEVRVKITMASKTSGAEGGFYSETEAAVLKPGETQQDGGAFSIGNHVTSVRMQRIQFGYPKARATYEGGKQICCKEESIADGGNGSTGGASGDRIGRTASRSPELGESAPDHMKRSADQSDYREQQGTAPSIPATVRERIEQRRRLEEGSPVPNRTPANGVRGDAGATIPSPVQLAATAQRDRDVQASERVKAERDSTVRAQRAAAAAQEREQAAEAIVAERSRANQRAATASSVEALTSAVGELAASMEARRKQKSAAADMKENERIARVAAITLRIEQEKNATRTFAVPSTALSSVMLSAFKPILTASCGEERTVSEATINMAGTALVLANGKVLCVIDVRTGASVVERTLTSNNDREFGATLFDPAGAFVVAQVERYSGGTVLYVFDAHSGDQIKVLDDAQFPALSPDGKILVTVPNHPTPQHRWTVWSTPSWHEEARLSDAAKRPDNLDGAFDYRRRDSLATLLGHIVDSVHAQSLVQCPFARVSLSAGLLICSGRGIVDVWAYTGPTGDLSQLSAALANASSSSVLPVSTRTDLPPFKNVYLGAINRTVTDLRFSERSPQDRKTREPFQLTFSPTTARIYAYTVFSPEAKEFEGSYECAVRGPQGDWVRRFSGAGTVYRHDLPNGKQETYFDASFDMPGQGWRPGDYQVMCSISGLIVNNTPVEFEREKIVWWSGWFRISEPAQP